MEEILVISDIHGNLRTAADTVTSHPSCHTVIFLGDGARHIDFLMRLAPDKAFYSVRGNCDTCLDGVAETETVIDICGHRIFACHGHTRFVKSGMGGLIAAAKEKGADIALFGHTHYTHDEYDADSGIYIFNPGSIGAPHDGHFTFGILTLDRENVLFSVGEAEEF